MSIPQETESIPKLTREEFFELEYVEGWDLVEGTREVDSSPRWVNFVTQVYRYGRRFYAVTLPENTGDGESADAYEPEVVEVFPRTVVVTKYEVRPLTRTSIMDLSFLSKDFLVGLNSFALDHYPASDAKLFSLAILSESERREWPVGWWEDPSVIPSEKKKADREKEAA